jgi:hypothetical protein
MTYIIGQPCIDITGQPCIDIKDRSSAQRVKAAWQRMPAA